MSAQCSALLPTVADAPRLEVEPANLTALEGEEDVRLVCLVDANPGNVTSVRWFRDGEEVQQDDRTMMVAEEEEDPVLVLNPVTRQDAGSFHCTAENGVGLGESSPAVLSLLCRFSHKHNSLYLGLLCRPARG